MTDRPCSAAPSASRPGSPACPGGAQERARVRERLTEPDKAVLRSLVDLHVATTRQVERLHFHDPKSPAAAARRTRRSVARLETFGLVEHLGRQIGGLRSGSVAHAWRLTPEGAQFVQHRPPRRTAEPSLSHLGHVLEVTELVVRLHERSRSDSGIDLVSVETEPACWRTYTGSRGRTQLLKPDLRVTLSLGGRTVHWFVEVDRDTERRPVLAGKVAIYLAAWRDGSEQARCGTFPTVLWVVPHVRRAETLRQVCQAGLSPEDLFAVAVRHAALDALTTPRGAR